MTSIYNTNSSSEFDGVEIMYAINPEKLIKVFNIPEHLIQQAIVMCQKCRERQNLSQEMADSDNLTIKYNPVNTFGKYIARSCFSEKCRRLQQEELAEKNFKKDLENEKQELEKVRSFMFCKCELCAVINNK